jgi:hypothetical protein
MKLHQLSLFVENRPGQLRAPCQALAEAGISILTLSLADTEQFGILRLIVKDWERARDLLAEAGFVVNVAEMIAIEVEDRPGGLAAILAEIEKTGLSIEYMYAFTCRRGGKAVLVFRFDDADAALRELETVGVNVVGGVDLYRELEGRGE